ncbi:bifunctional isocitrate dehydrogenase kinase/phosphatase [Caldilinea sp.]|uniref:bifunctional isocitrate dehydrogenase kinase/phosphatase n=1 Tax=Caldilinea sp. TaxID=2293560 RepID=UPI002C38E912|nr:bifunctional isocitrate dehydrogenase kinase/phosphatase [Anaerolineales bacterium]HQY91425.1 bifunctional isocitrate dehydrogenase kinase/phosphatase [Caldilinea sp.]HRA65747.1 bifunctional isocitrate dehydrogenase kinase/phosphatase [Caldilinea sp.]
MNGEPIKPNLARNAAATIHGAFDDYHNEFKAVTRRAQDRFERREWAKWQEDATERLGLREQVIQRLVNGLRVLLGAHANSYYVWAAIKEAYARLINQRRDVELAETFYNSVTRRILTTVGVEPELEFVWFGATTIPTGDTPIVRVYSQVNTLEDMIKSILRDYAFVIPYQDMEGDAQRVARVMQEYLRFYWETPDFDAVEMVKSVFYRNKGAYLVGRVRKRNRVIPIILPLLNTDEGILVDAALFSEEEASIVFSFTRSYFHVDVGTPGDLVGFLKSILPLKPVAELYISIGYNKHGKTERYRTLYRHLNNSNDKFEIARGARGMVMTVFTLPSYDMVFKIIKDRFAYPKTSTRAQVKDRYKLVFKHDRVGRMVDAQEFEGLSFSRDRFAPELLQELQETASNTVTITDDEVIIKHLYTERRLYPLDLYIKEMSLEKAKEAVIDYGHAIVDLATANIFPGDLFIKNFGVTRHGRVVFYDYDELCLLADCNFRIMPEARTYEDELSDQPWFAVAENDIFPEEFRKFLWFPAPLRQVMEAHHSQLFTVEFWRGLQERTGAGEILDFFPYDQERRFARA